VNALLRRVLADPLKAEADLTAPAAQANAPDWYWQRLLQAGRVVYAAHCAAIRLPPAFTLRYLGNLAQRDAWSASLEALGHRVTWSADKTLMVSPPANVEDLPGFADGVFRVQDSSAQRAFGLLPLQPGDRILDACAAPGGKSFLLLEQAPIALWSVDQSASRLARLEKEWQRLRPRFGSCQLRPLVADLAENEWPVTIPAVFDHIVLDAPCSGSGVLRRHPEGAWVRTASELETLVLLQQRLLDRLWRALRPGGQLLYITCSVFPEEGEQQIERFLHRTSDASRKPAPGQILPYYVDAGSTSVSGDGFFYARLEKRLG
jgi:16S rRNA (cytosine967-C5)-methyltransferase